MGRPTQITYPRVNNRRPSPSLRLGVYHLSGVVCLFRPCGRKRCRPTTIIDKVRPETPGTDGKEYFLRGLPSQRTLQSLCRTTREGTYTGDRGCVLRNRRTSDGVLKKSYIFLVATWGQRKRDFTSIHIGRLRRNILLSRVRNLSPYGLNFRIRTKNRNFKDMKSKSRFYIDIIVNGRLLIVLIVLLSFIYFVDHDTDRVSSTIYLSVDKGSDRLLGLGEGVTFDPLPPRNFFNY